jgi:fructose-6-phosphate aldolase, TalC/MipB family
MELFLDTADLGAIEELSAILPLAGVTTNPSIVAAGKRPLKEILPQIRKIVGPEAKLFAQVLARDSGAMIDEALRLSEIDPKLIVKIPAVPSGFAAIKALSGRGVVTLGTAVYAPMQGFFAAQAGAAYIAPYVNRVDSTGGDGIGLVQTLQSLLDLHCPTSTVLAASFRTPTQVLDCLLAGAKAVTVPPDVMRQMLVSPSVDVAIQRFEADWLKAFDKLSA